MNQVRQQLAYSRPGQSEVNRSAYERGTQQMGPQRTPGRAGFGRPDAGPSGAKAAPNQQNALLALIAMLAARR